MDEEMLQAEDSGAFSQGWEEGETGTGEEPVFPDSGEESGAEDREARETPEVREAPEVPSPPAGRLTRLGALEDIRRREDVREFRAIFPEAARNPGDIPPEVWAEVRQGRSLVGAYARYEAGRRDRTAANAARSTGSLRSAEGGLQGRDPFLQGFQD